MELVMKKTIFSLVLLGCAVNAHAASANYQVCTTTGCKASSSSNVTSSQAKTQYPIVFAHGLFGFGKVGPLDYWYQIPQTLVANGAQVFVTTVSAANSTAVRGEQLLAQVEDVIAITGKAKVNLMGHSHGGPTSRYVAGVAPQLVASVTSIAGPNKGSAVADAIAGISSIVGPLGTTVIGKIVNAFASLENPVNSQNALAALADLSSAGMASFNQSFPGGVPATACGQGAPSYQGVNYYSWGGNASSTGQITTGVDPLDSSAALGSLTFLGAANDGLVGTCSSHLGVVIRDDYYQNHFDEVNQTLGLISWFTTSPKTLFLNQANRLKMAGL
jgi:triacylglycerol lipase